MRVRYPAIAVVSREMCKILFDGDGKEDDTKIVWSWRSRLEDRWQVR